MEKNTQPSWVIESARIMFNNKHRKALLICFVVIFFSTLLSLWAYLVITDAETVFQKRENILYFLLAGTLAGLLTYIIYYLMKFRAGTLEKWQSVALREVMIESKKYAATIEPSRKKAINDMNDRLQAIDARETELMERAEWAAKFIPEL